MTALTWNIEGVRRHIFYLAEVLQSERCSLVFLSEPQAYQCDLPSIIQYIEHDYCYALNSDDLYDPDLPLDNSRAKGGTMLLWRKSLDPYVKLIKVSSSAFLPLLLTIPGYYPSVHVALYLPTHGQDTEFVSELASLKNCLDCLISIHSNLVIYLRGDANVNIKNTQRVSMLDSFMGQYQLVSTVIEHKTYHHFVGGGQFDSNVDVLLHSAGQLDCKVPAEKVTDVLCKKNFPAISSHHDVILSSFTLLNCVTDTQNSNPTTAPRLDHHRNKIIWSEEGSQDYSAVVGAQLRRIRDRWLKPDCQASMSLLLKLTNKVLLKAAMDTNEYQVLGKKARLRRKKIPRDIRRAKQRLNRAYRKFKQSPSVLSGHQLRSSKKSYHQTVRSQNLMADIERDSKLHGIMGVSPGKMFRHIKALKNTGNCAISKLTVGGAIYTGQGVADGFFESMSSLKKCDIATLEAVPELSDKLIDHKIIIELCQNHNGIPEISLEKSKALLFKIKKGVRDHYSISVEHYVYAGHEGLLHFNALLNAIIADLNNACIEELNTAHGLIFYKGHRKDKESDRSYRNISSCPFLAKALDVYVRDLCFDLWHYQQADTQYQGAGSSHELASLLLTEVIQHSLFVAKQPLYLLSLDAQSAFDRCLRQVLTGELYKAGVPPATILLIDSRLASRTTVYEWEGEMMGPARDITGFEQGGVNSSDYYKLYNNEQLKSAQSSKLGVDIGSNVISAIGQADDVILVAPSLYHLQLLVSLTEQYCTKFRVKLEPSKTKLLTYHSKTQSFLVDLALNCHDITINGEPVKRVKEAEHVGVLRSSAGNLPHIVDRIAMHKNAMHALLPCGLARRHRGNPTASLRLNQLYGVPVLLSGLASLVLSQSELAIIDGHFLNTLQRLLRLHRRTPRSITYFLAGSLPARALLHQRQLTLFTMICHLEDDPLHYHAEYALVHLGARSKSWFMQIRNLCVQYDLPHPLQQLKFPTSKARMKRLVKERILDYWQHNLAAEASSLSSLSYFNPRMHALSTPHPLWAAAGSNSYEVNKSTVLSRMISGRYRTEKLCRFWTDNREGFCLVPTCQENGVIGDLEHLLLHCPALQDARENLQQMWLSKSSAVPTLHDFVCQVLESPTQTKMKFILDPTSLPEVVRLWQIFGPQVLDMVFYLTRTFAYALHRKKLILIGKWPYATKNEDKNNVPDKINPCFIAGKSTVVQTSDVHTTEQTLPLARQGVPGVPGVSTTTAAQQADLALHTSGHGQFLTNSQPCLVHKPGGLFDPPVAPRECDGGGVADSEHLHISNCRAEHAQTVRGDSCSGLSGHNSDGVEARNVNLTEHHPFVHTDGVLLCAQCRGVCRGGLCRAGGVVARSGELFDLKLAK